MVDAPLWNAGGSSRPALQGQHSVDVAVVGAGPAGLACASVLAAEGVSVAVVEAGRVGFDGSARGEGMAVPGMAEHYFPLCEALGRAEAAAWWRLSFAGPAWLPFGEKGGVLLGAVNEAEFAEMTAGLRWLVEDGFEARMMGPAAATNYVPIDEIEGALYLPGARVFNPASALVSLASELTVWEESPALSVSPGRVVCEHGTVSCEVVVVAAGPGTGALLGLSSLFPLRGQIMTCGPVREGPRGVTPAVVCNRSHELYRRVPDGGMLCSGINPGSGWAEKTTELKADPVFGGFLEKTARGRFPEFTEVERLWAMVHTFTADGLPLVGPLPGHSRMHVLSGFGNRSWSLGVGAGVALGRVLAGLTAELPASAYARRLLN